MILMLPFKRILRKFVKILSFFFVRKMLVSAFLLRLLAYYLEKMPGYPNFSFWTPIALIMIYFFHMVLTWGENLCI